VNFLKPDSSNN